MDILFFGITKEIVGASKRIITSDDVLPKSVGSLKEQLQHEFPELLKLSSLAIAVNSEYALDTVPLRVNDEVAIIPPVSGG